MATALFWESIVSPEMDPDTVDDFNSFEVEFDVAGHEFDHGLIHLWLDPKTGEEHEQCHSLTTIDMTIEEARALVARLQSEIDVQEGWTRA